MDGPHRQNHRAACAGKCILAYNGSMQEFILKNISLSGAELALIGNETDILSGSRCVLYLCADTQACPAGYACQVIHTTATEIGLKFINQS